MNLFKGIAIVCDGGRRGRNFNENYVCARTSPANRDSRDSLIFHVKMEARFPFVSGIGISYFEQWSLNKLLRICKNSQHWNPKCVRNDRETISTAMPIVTQKSHFPEFLRPVSSFCFYPCRKRGIARSHQVPWRFSRGMEGYSARHLSGREIRRIRGDDTGGRSQKRRRPLASKRILGIVRVAGSSKTLSPFLFAPARPLLCLPPLALALIPRTFPWKSIVSIPEFLIKPPRCLAAAPLVMSSALCDSAARAFCSA